MGSFPETYNDPNRATTGINAIIEFHWPLYQNEVKCSAFEKEMNFHSHANKTNFPKKGCALGLTLKVRVFGTRKWPIYRSFNSHKLIM